MKKLISIFFLLFFSNISNATHLMGGQITARNIGGLDYEITLTLYRDTLGIPINPTSTVEFVDAAGITLGNLTISPVFQPAISLGNGVEKYVYIDTVSFPYAGTFKAFYYSCCRNSSILNLPQPDTHNMFLDALIFADSTNSSPTFLNDPITIAQDSVPFSYNPVPFDIDGDSLSWIMDIPLDIGANGNGTPIIPYFLPPSDASNPFSLNPLTGEITFTPIAVGNFQISVKAIEYRNGQPIGYIRRDMQLIVIPSPNAPIVVNGIPTVNRSSNNLPSIVVTPGQQLLFDFETLNPDNGAIEVSVVGDLFFNNNPAQIISNLPFVSNGTTTSTFTSIEWYPNQSNVSQKPYYLVFRVADFYGPFKFYRDYTYTILVDNNPTGIVEIPEPDQEQKIYSTIDVTGRSIKNDSSGLLIRIYQNGTVKKMFVFE